MLQVNRRPSQFARAGNAYADPSARRHRAEEFRYRLRSAETNLTHPTAEALRSRAKELRVNVPPCNEIQYRLGLGVEGQVNDYYLHVGNERFMGQNGIRLDMATSDRAALDELGHSCLHIAVDGKLAGLVPCADEIRAESRSIIRRLSALGIDLRCSGKVAAMVGDGINDSPALSFSDVGIAMRHGAEAAHESAHVS